jgi:membrane-bound lytic murein transglycosylase A
MHAARIASLAAAFALAIGAVSGSAQTGTADADAPAMAFWTKYAYFAPARFSDLPGWREDDLRDAWRAFRQTCNALGGRSTWSAPCARANVVRANDSDDVRRFLEREFTLYQIHNKDRTADGVITGYYEPLLYGSRRYGQGFVHPVYAVPDTLLFLDSRNIPVVTDGSPVFARVEGRNVISSCPDRSVKASCIGPYKLDLGNARPDVRDKRLRVRVEGDRIVPFFTRAQIEQGALRDGPVLLWVNDAAALYSMQVQGSGKVRLTDGQVVRLAYGEQNGHPFNPPVRAARKSMLTRGIAQADDDEDDVLSNEERTAAVLEVATRGVRPAADPAPAPAPAKKDGEELTPEVARMVDLLMKGTGSAGPTTITAASASAPAPKPKPAPSITSEPAVAVRPAPGSEERTSNVGYFAPGPSAFSVDPSYVFFRQIPDSDQGPLGALGVPLTAGRSVAVDPRTTPLGAPVFLSTGGAVNINRLMLAQDTGGAIRGPVRADYFWGFGAGAYAQASRMKENGRMWLLLPKAMSAALASGNVLTRSASGPTDKECLVADPDFCVE